MRFLALEIYDQDSKQALRVAVNPRYVVSVLTYQMTEDFLDDNSQDYTVISCTFELHHENVIDVLLKEEDARMLLISLHKTAEIGGEIVFKDVRTQGIYMIEPDILEDDNEE